MRAIEKFAIYPLANLPATELIYFGDLLVVETGTDEQGLSFHREGQGTVILLPPRRAGRPQLVRIAVSAA
jgi:hypothetical protein